MELPKLETATLKGGCREADGNLIASLSGSAELPVQEAMRVFVVQVQSAARAAAVKRVDVDLKGLKFMSSSCFKVMVTWLAALNDLPLAERYRVRFLSDAAQHWQKRSLSALAAFGGELVEVVE
jgi:hypothetical protein